MENISLKNGIPLLIVLDSNNKISSKEIQNKSKININIIKNLYNNGAIKVIYWDGAIINYYSSKNYLVSRISVPDDSNFKTTLKSFNLTYSESESIEEILNIDFRDLNYSKDELKEFIKLLKDKEKAFNYGCFNYIDDSGDIVLKLHNNNEDIEELESELEFDMDLRDLDFLLTDLIELLKNVTDDVDFVFSDDEGDFLIIDTEETDDSQEFTYISVDDEEFSLDTLWDDNQDYWEDIDFLSDEDESLYDSLFSELPNLIQEKIYVFLTNNPEIVINLSNSN